MKKIVLQKSVKKPFQLGMLEFQDPILLSALLYLLLLRDYSGFLRLSLLASVGHEMGHIFIYYCCTKTFPHIRVSATGLSMKLQSLDFSQKALAFLAAAGPITNFMLAGVTFACLEISFTLHRAAFLAANILLGLFNLLPIPPLDGSVIFRYLVEILYKKLHFKQE